jgi:hypothetical protein
MPPDDAHGLSSSVIIAAARNQLTRNAFRVTQDVGFTALPIDRSLLAEDDYSVIAIITYETWSQLEAEWSDAQAELVALLAKRLVRSAPKAWDGYLILMCTGSAPDPAAIALIERDTTRVRKIVATADTVRTISDVARILDPFMPLELAGTSAELSDILSTLPELLRNEVPAWAVEAVISAFRRMEPPLERLNQAGDDA